MSGENLFSPLIYKVQMDARNELARFSSLFYRCQVQRVTRAFLSKRARNAYRMGLAAIFGNPVCYNVGGNSATTLFDIVGD